MRHTRKLAGVLLAMLLALAMSVTAFAADIVINDPDSGTTYLGYKLLNATSDTTDTNWYYSVNNKYAAVMKTAAGNADMTDEALIDAIRGYNAEDLRTFADAVYRGIKGASISADATTSNKKFESADQGYWLIADATDNNGQDAANSLVILDTAGRSEVTVTPKKDTPTVEKKVLEDSNNVWQDGADYDIGDAVPFKLTGTLPDNYSSYTAYAYTFHDKLSDGLTFDADSVKVEIDGTDVTSAFTVKTGGAGGTITDSCSFEVTCADLKKVTAEGLTISADSQIVVTYTATLNENAVIAGIGNPNAVYLEYSNNPYNSTTGQTPEDKVTVFTFKLDVDKVDTEKNPLKGAGFTLYKSDGESGWTKVEEITAGETTKFTFTGLDSGDYKLVESTVPDGYNPIADILFTVEATYETTSDDPKLTNLVIKDSEGEVISGDGKQFAVTLTPAEDGINIKTTVENRTGAELPSTGGIGTTIFTVTGILLMLGAAVYLFFKKYGNVKGN